VAVLVTGAFLLRDPIRAAWRQELVRRALTAADDAGRGTIEPRLTVAQISRAASLMTPRRAAAAEALLRHIDDDVSPDALHGKGIAFFLGGDTHAAIDHFRRAVAGESHATWWSDLSAAELTAGASEQDPERYVAALEAADKALALEAGLSTARSNRALAIERLGFTGTAVAEWRKALAVEGSAAWLGVISAHVGELSRKPVARDVWRAAQGRLAAVGPAELEQLIDSHPQEARLWGESVFLPLWAQQRLAGENGDLYLDAARTIGNRLAMRSGERLLRDAVAGIDAFVSANDRLQLDAMALALTTYMSARRAFKDGPSESIGAELERTRRAFAACGSPMAGVAELYRAMNALQLNRPVEARPILAALIGREPGYVALTADAERFIALIDARNGHWGDALATATSASERFASLGESSNAAEAELLVGDIVGFLGQPHLAWRHFVRAADAFSSAGLLNRLQIAAAEMSFLEIGRQRWSEALAISRVELTLGTEPDQVAHAHLRAGLAAFELGDAARAQASLRAARIAARRAGGMTERLLGDIAGVEGRILSVSAPDQAIIRITESIDYQARSGRAFALPGLYLERGRAKLALGADAKALSDFEHGIAMLEVQRTRVFDYELRAGLLDHPRELFREAVSLLIRNGDVERAWEYLERGRARALLDELGDVTPDAEAMRVAMVRESLDETMLLVSYAVLPEGLAIFVVGRDSVDVRWSRAPPDDVRNVAETLVTAVRDRGDVPPAAARAYDVLIRPIRDRIDGRTTLVVVPDVVLEHVPFEALFDRSSRSYLVHSHELLRVPSAAVFVVCRRRAEAAGAAPPRSIAIFANPDPPSGLSLSSLPAADLEAPRIARRYAEPLLLQRELATAERFRREAPRHEVVQFSGHARVDRAEPWKSSLIFDQKLSAREVATMSFSRTRLAILGACSTLAPNTDRVEGTSAMAKSFLIAGVPAVIGSLWDVDDRHAAALMIRLHERLVRGLPAAAALRDVQREMSRDRHPAEWAAFTVLGADRP